MNEKNEKMDRKSPQNMTPAELADYARSLPPRARRRGPTIEDFLKESRDHLDGDWIEHD